MLPSSRREPSCAWIIQSHEDRIILLNVIHYQFKKNTWSQAGDVVAIGYGNNTFDPASALIIRHKDSAIFENMAFVGPLVWITFDSNNYKSDSNVLLAASEEDRGKGFVLLIKIVVSL